MSAPQTGALVDQIVKRFGASLTTHSKTAVDVEELIEEALVELSQYTCIDAIVRALVTLFHQVVESQNEHHCALVMQMTTRCMETQWLHLRSEYRKLTSGELSAEQLFENNQRVRPPPLPDPVVQKAIQLIHRCFSREELRPQCLALIRQLSASNLHLVLEQIRIASSWFSDKKNIPSGDDLPSGIHFIRSTVFDSEGLSSILGILLTVAQTLKKPVQQNMLARITYNMIWHWIQNCSADLTDEYQRKTRHGGNPEQLFECLEGWGKRKGRESKLWPAQMMLLVLCPDAAQRLLDDANGYSNHTKFSKFWDKVKKSVRSGKAAISETAAACYIDLIRVSTFLPMHISVLRELTVVERGLMLKTESLPAELKSKLLVYSFDLDSSVSNLLDALNIPFPTVGLKALLKLAMRSKNEENVPWAPKIDIMHKSLGPRVQKLFSSVFDGFSAYEMAKKGGDKKSKAAMEMFAPNLHLLEDVCELFSIDPNFAVGESTDLRQTRSILMGLTETLTKFDLPSLSAAARESLLILHEPENITYWSDAFWELSSAILGSLSDSLLRNRSLTDDQATIIVTTIEKLLKCRLNFVKTLPDVNIGSGIKELVITCFFKLEAALLVHLSSTTISVTSSIATSLALICDEIDITSLSTGFSLNYQLFRALGNSARNVKGRAHQQKIFRTLLCGCDNPTKGNQMAWNELLGRWRNAKLDKQRWSHMLGLLCASAGVVGARTDGVLPQLQKLGNIASVISDATSVVECFVLEVLDLVLSDDVSLREGAKKLLASSLSPQALPTFFRAGYATLGSYFESGGLSIRRNDASSILFVEQMCSLIKLILDRPLESDSLTLVTDFERFVLLLSRFISQVLTDPTERNMQTKSKFCSMIISVIAKKDLLVFSSELQFRESLVQMLMEWTPHFGRKENAYKVYFRGFTEQVKLVQSMDVSIVTAIVALLDGLELEEDAQSREEKFTKFFSFFTRLVQAARDDKLVPSKLGKLAIDGLSALLSANTEQGLNYFVTMGYNKDIHLRTAFLQVLSAVLKHGTSLGGGSADSKYDPLLGLLLSDEPNFLFALCETAPITEADDLAEVLLNIAESNGRTMEVIKVTLAVEIKKTSAPNNLFRTNSLATKILTRYTKMIGHEYLRSCLLPVIHSVSSVPGIHYEVDPLKLGESDDPLMNANNLINLAQKVLDHVEDTVDELPHEFRVIVRFINEAAKRKFPDAQATASTGGFLFLRFMCPALVSPDGYDLCTVTAKTRRALILCAKTMQNLANMTRFQNKEPYMKPMNVFIDRNIVRIKRLYEVYASVPLNYKTCPSQLFTEEQKEMDMERLHYILANQLAKIQPILRKSELGSLTAALSQLGAAPIHNPKKKMKVQMNKQGGKRMRTNTSTNELVRLMAEYANRDTSAVKEAKIFYRQGLSVRGHPVFYFCANKFTKRMDAELVMFYMLSESQSSWSKPFELVIDLTGLKMDNIMDKAWFGRLAQLIPDECSRQLKNVLLVNPGRLFRKVVGARWFQRLIPVAMQQRMSFATCAEELHAHVSAKECALPASTIAVYNLTGQWGPIEKTSRSAIDKREQIVIRMSANLLQSLTSRPVPVLGGTTALLDTLHISDLKELVLLSEFNELTVVYMQGGNLEKFVLKTSSAEQIMHALKSMKNRHTLMQPSTQLSVRQYSATDVPATLLNLAFLNLGSTNVATRTAGYDLLSSVCSYFHYDVAGALLEIPGLCIPKNNLRFVVNTSSTLAKELHTLTQEFVQECLHGVSDAPFEVKHLTLAYLKPWLPNLAPFFAGDNHERLTKILNMCTQLTNEEKEVGPAILAKIWKPLGRIPEAFDLSLQVLLQVSMETGVTDSIADAVTTMAAQNPQLMSEKLIGMLLESLKGTAGAKVSELAEHAQFQRISALTRMLLMCSFDNLIHVELVFAELVYIVSMTFSHGDWIQRVTVHRLLLNAVHSLSLRRSFVDGEDSQVGRGNVVFYLSELNSQAMKVRYGFGQLPDITPFSSNAEFGTRRIDRANIADAADVLRNARNLLDAISSDAEQEQWKNRWLELIEQTAFSPNLALQPQALIAFGVIGEATDDVVSRLITLLQDALQESQPLASQLPLSIAMALGFVAERLPPDSAYVRRLFWLALLLGHITDLRLFVASLHLLHNCLKAADRMKCFESTTVPQWALSGVEEGPLGVVIDQVQEAYGVSFQSNFSFALASQLLKGLKNPKTKTLTTKVLSAFFDVSARSGGVSADSLGYIAALTCVNADAVAAQLGASDASGRAQFLWTKELIANDDSAALLFAYWAVFVRDSHTEAETELLYELLVEGAHFSPRAFPVTYEILVPQLLPVVENGQNAPVISHVLRLSKTMLGPTMERISSADALSREDLDRLQFTGMLDCGVLQRQGVTPPSDTDRNGVLTRHWHEYLRLCQQ